MWREAFAAQAGLLNMLHRIPVKAGDFVFVDGGVPHAIGGGCFMVELQEPSDLMVVAERFTPSGRRIPDAKMHGGVGWEKMFDVYEYDGRTFEETCAKYVSRPAARNPPPRPPRRPRVDARQGDCAIATAKFEARRFKLMPC